MVPIFAEISFELSERVIVLFLQDQLPNFVAMVRFSYSPGRQFSVSNVYWLSLVSDILVVYSLPPALSYWPTSRLQVLHPDMISVEMKNKTDFIFNIYFSIS